MPGAPPPWPTEPFPLRVSASSKPYAYLASASVFTFPVISSCVECGAEQLVAQQRPANRAMSSTVE